MHLNEVTRRRFLREIGLPYLLGFLLLSGSRIIKILPKKVKAKITTPMLTIILEEDPENFISQLQDLGDEAFTKSPQELLNRGADALVEEVLGLYPILEPYKPYLLNYMRIKEKESRDEHTNSSCR